LGEVGTHVLSLMRGTSHLRHHDHMSVQGRPSPWAVAPYAIFVVAGISAALLVFGPTRAASASDWGVSFGTLVPCVCLGALVTWRAPSPRMGLVIAYVAVAPAVVRVVELWGVSVTTDRPWPGADVVSIVAGGFWVWTLAGFVALCLLFPDGRLPGHRWRLFPYLAAASGVLLNAAVSLDASNFASHGGDAPGEPPWVLPSGVRAGELIVSFGSAFCILGACVRALVVRYRSVGETVRTQIRWLVLGAGAVPVMLALGWVGELAGLPVAVAYPPFILALVVGVPACVTVAILRHDLFDVDRLLGSGLALALTALVSASVYATVVFALVSSLGTHLDGETTGAAFVTALCLLPCYHLARQLVGRIIDRERITLDARLRTFVRAVRDGEAEAEDIEGVLRSALDDERLRLLIRLPGSEPGQYVDLHGASHRPPDGSRAVPLLSGSSEMGVVVLGRTSARALRRAREAALVARLPIEVSRLRLELRLAMAEVNESRSRLVEAVADERQSLERDLHDGAQQRVVALGMRLRSIQGRLGSEGPEFAELDVAVASVEQVVGELRRIAHGIRPSRLSDSLAAALKSLAVDTPVPVDLDVVDVELSESVATSLYYVAAEGVANALKHAAATRISVALRRTGEVLELTVTDDGNGGAVDGFGVTSMRDRVASVGGTFSLASPSGLGTQIKVVI